MADNKYNKQKHDSYITCPRERCGVRNAPKESDDFRAECWKCNTYLNVQPVQAGDEVVVTIDDIHQSGAGVGKTEHGFVVLVEGVLPTKRATVRIDRVKKKSAWAEKVIEVEEIDEEEIEEDDDDSPALGARDNYWGG